MFTDKAGRIKVSVKIAEKLKMNFKIMNMKSIKYLTSSAFIYINLVPTFCQETGVQTSNLKKQCIDVNIKNRGYPGIMGP